MQKVGYQSKFDQKGLAPSSAWVAKVGATGGGKKGGEKRKKGIKKRLVVTTQC